MWKDAIVVQVLVLSHQWHAGTEETHEYPWSAQSLTWSIFELCSFEFEVPKCLPNIKTSYVSATVRRKALQPDIRIWMLKNAIGPTEH
jgi:hypothetical protein